MEDAKERWLSKHRRTDAHGNSHIKTVAACIGPARSGPEGVPALRGEVNTSPHPNLEAVSSWQPLVAFLLYPCTLFHPPRPYDFSHTVSPVYWIHSCPIKGSQSMPSTVAMLLNQKQQGDDLKKKKCCCLLHYKHSVVNLKYLFYVICRFFIIGLR